MSVVELKEQVRAASPEERRELAAYIFDLEETNPEAEAKEISRLQAEMNSGKKVSLEEAVRLHEALLGQGR